MSKRVKVILFLILLTAISAGAYFLLTQKNNDSFVAQEISIKQADVQKEDRVYEDYAGFSFEYPAEMKVEAVELDDSNIYSSLEILALDNTKLSLRIADTKLKSLEAWQKEFEDKNVVIEIKDVFFSDLNAKKVVYGAPKQMKTVSIEDGVIYELSSLADDGFMEKVHEQIVNSFEFSSEVFVEEETEEPETTTSGEIVLVEESLE